MPFTVTFTATAFVAGSLRNSSDTLLVDDPTARMLVDLGVATAPGLTPQTGAVAPNLARTDGATFTGKINTPAATTASAFFNLAHGVAPSAPQNGDIWTTTGNIQWRRNGATHTLPNTGTGNTFAAGQKQTFSHNATTAGLNVGPVAGNPSSLANGDIWTNSTTGIMTARSNGMSGQVGAVKAWVNFNGTGTVAIRSSFNVTSITDNGTGDYTVNFTVAMVDVNYTACMAGSTPNGGGASSGLTTTEVVTNSTTLARTTTAFRFHTYTVSWNFADALSVSVAILR